MTSGDGTVARRGPSPGVWGAIVSLLVIVVVVLAALLFLGFGGDNVTEVIVQECTVGEPGCELRQGVHWHANFAVFLNGEAYDFNDPRFLVDDPDDPRENVNMHEPRYTVIHVHREQTTFNEFFKSLEWKLTDSCITTVDGEEYCNSDTASLKFVANGVRIDSLLFQDITDLARVLISYGDETDEQLMEQFDLVGDDACVSSDLCRERAPAAGLEPEPCTGRGACN